ncbi:conserved exported protein of unknown function [Latilactobacillus sakei]|uniref:LPXTG cell wall anchor domain-containing protein n=1 Tax=Latilactobacillus sakei TaxID=1599 RepID=UPI000C6F2794|nr:LPXTG cell wall anchor domain-containing protein [Latilactobacillus sakei]USS38879.1 LPXTG cell wall anchor domain-containing protein [Latilactobacillus sakei]SON66348.1 conserved exported protein of unknown function [Latilactobacillus sakei]
MRWLKNKSKFVVLMLIIGSGLIVVNPTHTSANAQTATKSVARVGFYETGQPHKQAPIQTETKQQARLPQTGTSSVGLSTIVGIVLLIGSLGLFKQKRGNF